MTDTRDNRRGARRLWLWRVAVLVSFPIGGYLADLVVGGVDSVWAALVGGLIAGLIIGVAEWFALRRWVSWLWIVATSIGMAAGLTAGAALVGYGISRGDLLLMGAVTGLGVGVLQALVHSRSRVSGALWWAVANPPGWALGWLVTSYVITRNVKDQFTNIGASGARLRTADVAPPHSVVPKHRTRSHTMNIQNAAGAVTFSVLSGVLLNVLLPVRASNATVDAGPAGAGLKDNA